MNTHGLTNAFTLFLWSVLATGCSRESTSPDVAPRAIRCEALYSETPILIDGRLDEAVWKKCPSFRLSALRDNKDSTEVQEPGDVRFAWDDTYFYIAASFKDSDIVAEGHRDQLHHYRLGDVCELFLKPDGQSWYWELFATPKSKKTCFWYPSRGRLGLPSCFADSGSGLEVAAQLSGTLNDWTDVDEGWTAEVAVPIKELTSRGEKFGPGATWHLCVGRYNYSKNLDNRELSTFPGLSRTDFHLFEEYSVLHLLDVSGREAEKDATQVR